MKKKNGVRVKKTKETFFAHVFVVGKKMWQQMDPINLSPHPWISSMSNNHSWG